MCSTDKLGLEEDQLELRVMDDFFSLEQNVFQVGGVFRLCYEAENDIFVPEKETEENKEIRLKELAEKEKAKRLAAQNEEAPPEEEEGEKKPDFEPLKSFWTNTNR